MANFGSSAECLTILRNAKASQDSTFGILNKASSSPAAVPDACRASMQLACDAPVNSRVSAHANKHPLQPMAKLTQKELSFSTLLSVLHGHEGKISHKSDQRYLYSPGSGHVNFIAYYELIKQIPKFAD